MGNKNLLLCFVTHKALSTWSHFKYSILSLRIILIISLGLLRSELWVVITCCALQVACEVQQLIFSNKNNKNENPQVLSRHTDLKDQGSKACVINFGKYSQNKWVYKIVEIEKPNPEGNQRLVWTFSSGEKQFYKMKALKCFFINIKKINWCIRKCRGFEV